MSDNTLGILIIIGIIIIGIVSGGAIFKGGSVTKPSEKATSSISTNIYNTGSTQKTETGGVVVNPADSIYKGKVKISSVSQRGTFGTYVRLSTGYNIGGAIPITGWKLKSSVTGNEQIIGRASNLPYLNSSAEYPVVLTKSSRVIVSSAQSPINISFRTNKCTGFFAQYINFTPLLDKNCPAPKDNAPKLSNEINNACLDYINRMPICEVRTESDLRDEKLRLTNSCKQYILTNINYNTCVALHKNDADFYSQEWRIYSDKTKYLWLDRRDTILLIDSYGKIVDTYSYN